MTPNIAVLDDAQVASLIGRIDIARALRALFVALHAGRAVQPPQTLAPFPDGAGDFISYPAVLADAGTFGVKLSPYIVAKPRPVITAWTFLMSMETGQPIMLCDAARLTIERTAGVTALAVDLLAQAGAERLAIIGTGAVAQAHLRHVLALRDWRSIAISSPSVGKRPVADFASFTDQDPRVRMLSSTVEATRDADVILLCTSSGQPVLDPSTLIRPALITSISTNAARAHEIPPQSLAGLDVYCDYRATAPASAGEMVIARERHGWSPDAILGDLPELVSGATPESLFSRDSFTTTGSRSLSSPSRRERTPRHAFFRSIGMGLEDIAVATELHRALAARPEGQGR